MCLMFGLCNSDVEILALYVQFDSTHFTSGAHFLLIIYVCSLVYFLANLFQLSSTMDKQRFASYLSGLKDKSAFQKTEVMKDLALQLNI